MTSPTEIAEPCVIGLDLALVKTGIAHADGTTEVFKAPDKTVGVERLVLIRDRILAVLPLHTELVVIEDYAPGAMHRALDIGELGGVVRCALWDSGVPYMLVNPNVLKRYATGTGRADKFQVMQAAEKRLGYTGHFHDESDALWLRAVGWALLGQPIVELPLHHVEALEALFRRVPIHRSVPKGTP
jgi:Holliday junction resolvasome RuvABC endonuclease subunit